MLSLTNRTLYEDIVDSGLKLIEDNQNEVEHEYTVELGYRDGNGLNIEQVDFTEDQNTGDLRAQVEGSESALNAVINLLDEEYELETEEDTLYVTY